VSVLLRRITFVTVCCVFVAAQAKPLPNLKFRDLAGRPQRLDSLRGSITVISLWATWCAPCRDELPRLSQLNRRYAENGVRFLAISIDESKDRTKIEPYLQEQKVVLEVWVGADVDTLGRLGLGDIVPGTLVVDKDGEVVGRIMGEARDSDVTGYLDWLLSNRQGSAPEPLVKRY
jgi:thiol-disulfide isomerase/thioredoxin